MPKRTHRRPKIDPASRPLPTTVDAPTWRDELAARAMQVLINKSESLNFSTPAGTVPIQHVLIANGAYAYADLMIRAAKGVIR